MGKYEIKIEKSGADFKVAVSGVIDEDADFNPHSLAGSSSVSITMGGVKSINSCGIREWIKWIKTAATASVTYHECPKIIVDQINMVQGFLPANGKVMSFYVPYYNEEAGTEKNVLFTNGKEYSENKVNPPASVTDEAGRPMEMDVVEAKYFKFITK